MDKRLSAIIDLKIKEVFDSLDDINTLITSLNEHSRIEDQENISFDKKSLYIGIIIGRLYNSFYYQTRRIMKRDPTHNEFLEFVEIIKKNNYIFSRKEFH